MGTLVDVMAGNVPLMVNPKFIVNIDEVSADLNYIGEAPPGTAGSTAGWLVKRVNKSGTVTSVRFANGSAQYNQVWDDRATATY